MPGVRIALTADEATAALAKFRANLKATGADTIKTQSELKSLEAQMLKTANAGKLSSSFNDLTRSLGLTKKQAQSLSKDLNIGDAVGGVNKAEGAFSGLGMTMMKVSMAALSAYMAFNKFKSLVMEGVAAIDEYKISVISLAAMWTSSSEAQGRGLSEIYQQNKAYAQELTLWMEEFDKETLLGAKDLMVMTVEMSKQGVILDINNKKQAEGFKNLANALAIVTAGAPNKQIQLHQEIGALMRGEARVTDQLGQMLKAQVPDLEQQVKLHKENGDLLEWLGDQLVGFAAAQGDINATWEATKSTLETIYNQVLRKGFAGAYQDILSYTKRLSEWALDHKEQIQQILRDGWDIIKTTLDTITTLYKIHKEELAALYKFTMLILYGFESLMAILPSIGQEFSKLVNFSKSIAYSLQFIDRLTAGDTEGVAAAWENMGKTVQQWKEMQNSTDNVDKNLARIGDKVSKLFQPNAGLTTKEQRPEYEEKYKPEPPKLRRPPGEEGKAAKGAKDQTASLNKQIQDEIDKMVMDAVSLLEKQANEYLAKGANAALVKEWLRIKKEDFYLEDYNKMMDQIQKTTDERLKAENEVLVAKQETANRILQIENEIATKQIDLKLEQGELLQTDAVEERYKLKLKEMEVEEALLIVKMQAADVEGKSTDQLYQQLVILNEQKKALDINKDIEKEITTIREKQRVGGTLGFYDPGRQDEMRKQIDKQTDEMRKLGFDEIGIRKWVAAEYEKIEVEKWQHIVDTSDDAMEAIGARLELYVIEARHSAKYWVQAFEQSVDAMKSTMGDFFNDFLNGELKSAEEYFQSFARAVNRALADALAGWVVGKILGGFKDILGMGASSDNTQLEMKTSITAATTAQTAAETALDAVLMTEVATVGALTASYWALSAAKAAAGMGGGGGTSMWSGIELPSFGYAKGAVFSRGQVVPFAAGDIISRPTYFPMAQGKMGVMGENGIEAIMPLARNSKGELGVKGQTQNNLTISIPINVNGQSQQKLTGELRREVERTVEKVVRRHV